MFTFYDSSNGSIQSLPEDYLSLSLKDIKNAIYQKSQIQHEKQILLSPQGHEINEANRAIYLTASESQPICVFSDDFFKVSSSRDLRISPLPDLENDFHQFTNLDQSQTTIGQKSDVAQSIYNLDAEWHHKSRNLIVDCKWIVYSIKVALNNLDQVKALYRSHLAKALDLFNYYDENFQHIQDQIHESEQKIGELDSLLVPAGLSGMQMTALEYLESEGDLAKTYEEILEATRDNFKRTSLETVQNAQKRFEALLDDAIRPHEEIDKRINYLEEKFGNYITLVDEQSKIKSSIEITASRSSFSEHGRRSNSNSSQLRIMLTNNSAVKNFTQQCIDSKLAIFNQARSIVRDIFSRQSELYEADTRVIKLRKRVGRIKELFEVIVSIPSANEVQSVIDEVFLQNRFLTSYEAWHSKILEKVSNGLEIERARRSNFCLRNNVLKKLISNVEIPDDRHRIPNLLRAQNLQIEASETSGDLEENLLHADTIDTSVQTVLVTNDVTQVSMQTSMLKTESVSTSMPQVCHADVAVLATVKKITQSSQFATQSPLTQSIGTVAMEVNAKSSLATSCSDIGPLENKTEFYRDRIEALEKTLNSSNSEIQGFKVKMSYLEDHVTGVEKHLSQKSSQIENLESQLVNESIELGKAEKEKKKLLDDFNRISSENESRMARIENLSAELDQSRNERKKEKFETDQLIRTLQSEHIALKEQFQLQELDTDRRIAEFQAQIASLECEKLDLAQEKNEAEAKIVELNIELNSKTSSISDLESRLEIKSSKSPIPVTEQPSRLMSQSVMITSGSSPVPILPQMSSSLYLNPSEPIFTLEHFQQGSHVCVVFNAEQGHYILLTSHSHFYFLHENCLEELFLPPPSELNDHLIRRFGFISEKPMHCVTRRANNRFKIPANTRFYRVKVKPHPTG
jgi:hypothetical protein